MIFLIGDVWERHISGHSVCLDLCGLGTLRGWYAKMNIGLRLRPNSFSRTQADEELSKEKI